MRGYYAVIVAALAIVVSTSCYVGAAASRIPREPECPLVGTARFPHPEECTQYYVCQDGKSTIQTCPHGLHFNVAIKQCDWPPAGCFPGKPRPETQPNVPDAEVADSSRCFGTCPLPDPMDKTIHLPYSGDCTRFCKCSYGIPFVMNCPPMGNGKKLHWDKQKDICNWPEIAGCQQ